jgi:hypothetical protein
VAIGDNLQIYLRFKAGYAEDQSGNGRDMDPVAAPTFNVLGLRDAALDLAPASSLLRSADDGVFDFGAGEHTISFWIKPGAAAIHVLTEKFATQTGPGWTIYTPSGLNLEIYRDGGVLMTTANVLTVGAWSHVVLRRQVDTWTFWHNGVVAATVVSAAATVAAGRKLGIGVRTDGGFGYTGQFDEYAIWTRALSDAEIATVYGSGAPGYLLDPKIGRYARVGGAGLSTKIGQHGFHVAKAGWATALGPP